MIRAISLTEDAGECERIGIIPHLSAESNEVSATFPEFLAERFTDITSASQNQHNVAHNSFFSIFENLNRVSMDSKSSA
jgi:hypothetical protein